ncbi:K(+)-transporting ATPase subunit F [Paenibacillus sp. F411]|nr:K(+)-transporting ATPase subunit F [Paenibacillus sp. F411]
MKSGGSLDAGYHDGAMSAAIVYAGVGTAELGEENNRGRELDLVMWLLGIVTFLVAVYLVYALISPEKF